MGNFPNISTEFNSCTEIDHTVKLTYNILPINDQKSFNKLLTVANKSLILQATMNCFYEYKKSQ